MKDKLNDVAGLTKRLMDQYPDQTEAFMSFVKKAEASPALTVREKELINVGIAIAGQCEWCIAVHVKSAIANGATRDELVEAGFMAVVMHGGPALMYMVPLMEALDEFSPDKEA
ncbi:carboxymuconolactone decarboxylase family protein [Neorhodopirellula lusitana]|nr:carboxymuconolactone decarboxylase family protein [Neorhodopirellula lusitana]